MQFDPFVAAAEHVGVGRNAVVVGIVVAEDHRQPFVHDRVFLPGFVCEGQRAAPREREGGFVPVGHLARQGEGPVARCRGRERHAARTDRELRFLPGLIRAPDLDAAFGGFPRGCLRRERSRPAGLRRRVNARFGHRGGGFGGFDARQVRFQHVSVRIGQRQTVVAVSGPVPVSEVKRLQDGRELDGVIYGPHGRLLLLVVGTGRGRQYCGRQQRQQQGFFYSLHN